MSTDAPERPLFPRSVAMDVFVDILRRFEPSATRGHTRARCARICAVGGFRRGKKEMKDLEILYVPAYRRAPDPADLFGAEAEFDDSARCIAEMVVARVIEPRIGANGSRSWGPANKYAVHCATGMPVDIFMATAANYHNRLVVTTGPRELNIRIASAAHSKNYEWEVSQGGFVPRGMTWQTAGGCRLTMRSEAELFKFVDLPFMPPPARRG